MDIAFRTFLHNVKLLCRGKTCARFLLYFCDNNTVNYKIQVESYASQYGYRRLTRVLLSLSIILVNIFVEKGLSMNIIHAIIHLVQHPIVNLMEQHQGRNRVNNVGTALEEYIKDLFANSLDISEQERLERRNRVFSYLGNNSNPPDAMLRGGDAIEIKKIESFSAALALNSSQPKHTLVCSSPMLSSDCRSAENWAEKDIIYAVGMVERATNQLKYLCMVYGQDYCASAECYDSIKTTIKDGVESIPGIECEQTRELGRINRVDPLGITYLRVRGMWGIENPWRVFRYIYEPENPAKFNFMCIINDDKWEKLENTDLLIQAARSDSMLQIKDVRVKNPDNPAELRSAKLISYRIEDIP